jgi:hypothetical protein
MRLMFKTLDATLSSVFDLINVKTDRPDGNKIPIKSFADRSAESGLEIQLLTKSEVNLNFSVQVQINAMHLDE